MFSPPQSEASPEMFSFDLRKEIALRELICAVADLDEMFPPNFMKSHFNAMLVESNVIAVPCSVKGCVIHAVGTANLYQTSTFPRNPAGQLLKAAAACACGTCCSTLTTILFS
jgi:Na+-transporting NADH:ubiquinone oxidoreductase subunit NqrE